MSAIRSQVRNSKLMTQRSRQVMQARRLKALQWAVALALGTSVCGSAYAMRVGHSRVVSVPGAPLQAVVGLQELTPDEIASLRVSVADEAAWQRAGLKPPVPLADLVVGVENGMDATRKNLRVRSSQAPASGAVDLLLDISSSAGQRQVQVSILVRARARRDATPASVGGKARAGASAGGATLNVKPGDTLYAIAQRNAVPGASIYQMLVALWRANPQAFIQSNMNLLKAGQKLSIPDADAVRDRSGRGAPDLQRACRSLRQYRSRLGAAAGANPTVVKGQSAASGTVSRSGDTGAASAASAQDRLRLSNGQDGGQARRRPGRCQGVRRTRDGRCAGAGDYVAGQRGRVEQGGGRAGRGRTGRCDGRWRCCGIGGCCRRCGPAAPLALRVLRARRGRWGGWIWRCGRRGRYRGIRRRGGWCWRRRIDWRDRRGRRCRIDRSNGAAGSAGTTRGRRRGFEFCCGSGGRRGCCGFRRRRFGCGPGRRFRRFGTRRQERCGPEAVRSAGRRAVLADRQSAGDRHRRAGAARLHHRLGAAPARAVAMTTRKPTLTPSRRWTRRAEPQARDHQPRPGRAAFG